MESLQDRTYIRMGVARKVSSIGPKRELAVGKFIGNADQRTAVTTPEAYYF